MNSRNSNLHSCTTAGQQDQPGKPFSSEAAICKTRKSGPQGLTTKIQALHTSDSGGVTHETAALYMEEHVLARCPTPFPNFFVQIIFNMELFINTNIIKFIVYVWYTKEKANQRDTKGMNTPT